VFRRHWTSAAIAASDMARLFSAQSHLAALLHLKMRRLGIFGKTQLLSGQRRSFTDANSRAVGLAYGSSWDSFVGNVLGRSGPMAVWTYTAPAQR
jgi:hypothetical protein